MPITRSTTGRGGHHSVPPKKRKAARQDIGGDNSGPEDSDSECSTISVDSDSSGGQLVISGIEGEGPMCTSITKTHSHTVKCKKVKFLPITTYGATDTTSPGDRAAGTTQDATTDTGDVCTCHQDGDDRPHSPQYSPPDMEGPGFYKVRETEGGGQAPASHPGEADEAALSDYDDQEAGSVSDDGLPVDLYKLDIEKYYADVVDESEEGDIMDNNHRCQSRKHDVWVLCNWRQHDWQKAHWPVDMADFIYRPIVTQDIKGRMMEFDTPMA